MPFSRSLAVLAAVSASTLLPMRSAADSPAAPEGRPRLALAGDWRRQCTAHANGQPGPGAWEKKAATLPGTTTLPEGQQLVWFEKRLAVPAAWRGSRVVLHAEHPVFAVAVYANGTRVGEIAGYGGEVDLAPALRWGEENAFWLAFGRGGAGTALDVWAAGIVAKLKPNERNRVGLLGPAEDFYLERQSAAVRVVDVWYRSWTRGPLRVEPSVTIEAARPLAGVRARVSLYPDDKSARPLVADFVLGDLPAGESRHVLTMPAKGAKLWGLREPNLYRGQVLLLDAAGQELDRSPLVGFGIRDFWLQGNRYYLNSQAVNLTLDAYLFPGGTEGLQRARDAGVTLIYEKHAAAAANLVHDDDAYATACDRLGLGHIAYGVGVGFEAPDLADPPVLAAYRRWVEAHVRRYRNHPSILFWALSTNFAGGDTHTPTVIGHSRAVRWSHVAATLSYLEHRRADDSRPAFHHQAGGTADLDTGNVYFNHLPLQEAEDWLSDLQECGDRPFFAIEFSGAPLLVDYLKHYTNSPRVSYVTEYLARLAGPRAYAEETPQYLDYATYRVPRLGSNWDYDPRVYSSLLVEQQSTAHLLTYRACRYRGVPADLWVWPPDPKKLKSEDEPAYQAAKTVADVAVKVLAPSMFWIGGPPADWTAKNCRYQAGETVCHSLLAVHDVNAVETVTVEWSAAWADGGPPVASHREEVTLSPWSRLAQPWSLPAPEVTTVRTLRLAARVLGAGGAEIARDALGVAIWPRPQPVAASAASFAVLDPEGETSALLQQAGAQLSPFIPQAPRPPVLILGRRALQGDAKLPFTAADVRAGLRVVICEQAGGDLERLGFRVENHYPRVFFPRSPEHPLLDGLDTAALHDWRGASTMLPWGPERDPSLTAPSRRTHHWSNRGVVASNLLETPQFGSFQALIDGEFDLGYTPLLSWRHGSGEVLFVQLDVTARSVADPAAAQLVRNLVRYLQAPLPGRPRDREAVCLSAATQARVAALGFAAGPWRSPLEPRRHLLVLSGDDAAAWNAQRAAAVAFADAGGDVLVFGASAALLADPAFQGLTGEPWRTNCAALAEAPSELLAGVGPQQLHWREPLDLTRLNGSGRPGFQRLLDGLLGVLPQGRGRILVLQALPEAVDDIRAAQAAEEAGRQAKEKALPATWYAKDRNRSRWQLLRLNSLLLSNLGAASADELAATLFANQRKLPFYPIDKWCYLGPFPAPADPEADPVGADLSACLAKRVLDSPIVLPSGQSIKWYMPNDFNNGLGTGGAMDLGKVYGTKERQGAVAVSYLWSSQERVATFQVGADWWLRFEVNGKEAFRTGTVPGNSGRAYGTGFAFTVKAPLRKGWNELLCTVASGGNGNGFWAQVSNPGDALAEQALTPPGESPMLFLRFAGGERHLISGAELEALEAGPRGFSLYAGPLSVNDDPYLYMRW